MKCIHDASNQFSIDHFRKSCVIENEILTSENGTNYSLAQILLQIVSKMIDSHQNAPFFSLSQRIISMNGKRTTQFSSNIFFRLNGIKWAL